MSNRQFLSLYSQSLRHGCLLLYLGIALMFNIYNYEIVIAYWIVNPNVIVKKVLEVKCPFSITL